MSAPVDVLAVLLRAELKILRPTPYNAMQLSKEIGEARAAIANLIKADQELQFIRNNGCAAETYAVAVERHDAAIAGVTEGGAA